MVREGSAPHLVALLLVLCSESFGAMAANVTCSGGGLALTPDLYLRGLAAYKDAACIPEKAFCDDEIYCPGVPGSVFAGKELVLNGMKHLRYIGTSAFRSFKGKLTVQGSFPKLGDVKDYAFYNAQNVESSFTLDGDLAAPSLFHVGIRTFAGFGGTITITGPFPSWVGVSEGAFKDAGNTQSVIALRCRHTFYGDSAYWATAFAGFNGDHNDEFENVDCSTTTATTVSTTTTATTTSPTIMNYSLPKSSCNMFVTNLDCIAAAKCNWEQAWDDSLVNDGNGGNTNGICKENIVNICAGMSRDTCDFINFCTWVAGSTNEYCNYIHAPTRPTRPPDHAPTRLTRPPRPTQTTSPSPSSPTATTTMPAKTAHMTDVTPQASPKDSNIARTTSYPRTTALSNSTGATVVIIETNTMAYALVAASGLVAALVLVAGANAVKRSKHKRLSKRSLATTRAQWAPVATAETLNAVFTHSLNDTDFGSSDDTLLSSDDLSDVPLLDLGESVTSSTLAELSELDQPYNHAMSSAGLLLIQHTGGGFQASFRCPSLLDLSPSPVQPLIGMPQDCYNVPVLANKEHVSLVPFSTTLIGDFLETSSSTSGESSADQHFATGPTSDFLETSSSGGSSADQHFASGPSDILKGDFLEISSSDGSSADQHFTLIPSSSLIKVLSRNESSHEMSPLSASILNEGSSVPPNAIGIAEWNSNVPHYPILRAHKSERVLGVGAGASSTHSAMHEMTTRAEFKVGASAPYDDAYREVPDPGSNTLSSLSSGGGAGGARASTLAAAAAKRRRQRADASAGASVGSSAGAGICSARGCSTSVVARGRCHKHGKEQYESAVKSEQCESTVKKGGKKTCARPGCTTNAASRGVCILHSSESCGVKGCLTRAHANNVCRKHGAHGTCTFRGCRSFIVARGRCHKHGANGICNSPGCTGNAVGRGVCTRHGARGTCTAQGCSANATVRGRCKNHQEQCSVENCTTNTVKRGLCNKHGAQGTCTFLGCSTNAAKRGLCVKHGANPVCSVQKCTTNAQARGLCTKHGAHGTCSAVGCTTNAQPGCKGQCKVHSR